MSKEEINLLKDEIYQKLRELEKKINDETTTQKDELNSFYNKTDEKIAHILTNNREIIESVVSEKINYEKIHALENFKNKADGILISHEIRINNNNKDINNMKAKYDRVIVDNLSVPGYVGSTCQYKNIGEYIVSTINEFSRFKYEKDFLKQETKELKTKMDNMFKQIISLVDNSVERCKEYTNNEITEYKKQFDTKFGEFEQTAREIRLEMRQTKNDIEEQVNHLQSETEKLLNMNEKLNAIDKSIKKLNNLMDRTNYDINKLYDNSKNYEKLITNLKNDISKTQKYISNSRSKNKKSKEKDNDKNRDRSKNRNSIKEKRLGSTHEMNKISNNQKRSTIFVQEDRRKLSDLNEDSPKKSFHASISNNKNNILEKISEKRTLTSEEQLKVPNNNNVNINKNDNIKQIKDFDITNNKINIKLTNEKKEEIKNDFEIINNNDIYINKENNDNNDNNNIQIINDNNINDNFRNSNTINNNLNNEPSEDIYNNIYKDMENEINNENNNNIDNTDNYNNITDDNKNDDNNNKIITNKIIAYKMNLRDKNDNNKNENETITEKKEDTESINSFSKTLYNKNKNELEPYKNYDIKFENENKTDKEILKKFTNRQNYNLFNNKANNSFLNNHSHSNSHNNDNSIINNNLPKKIYQLNKIEFDIKKKSLKKSTYNHTAMETNIFPLISGNKNEIFLNGNYNDILDDNNDNFNINNDKNKDNTDKQKTLVNKNDTEHYQNSKSNSGSKSNSTSNINSNMTSNMYNSNISSSKTSNRNSFSKTNDDNKKINQNIKKHQRKFNVTNMNNNLNEQNSNFQTNIPQVNKNNLRPIISPHPSRIGVNYVGLNIDNFKTQDEDDYDDIRLSLSGKKLKNLRLEGIGVSSPNSQKNVKKKIRLQGISTEAPLKISAAFGRTAYTFIDKNNEKNKLYSIKMIKQKKENNNKNNLDIVFAPNNI